MSFEAIGYVKQLELGSLEDPAKRLLLITIAENTFNDSFRCKIEQKQLAHDCARVCKKTISRHLKKLETAKIIKRHHRHLKQGGRLPDAIEIVGFEEHYQKRKAEEEKKSKEREADNLSLSGAERDSLSTGLNSDPTHRQQVSVSTKDPVLSGTEDKISPPTPHVRLRTRGERERALLRSILKELEQSHARVVIRLLRPVLSQRPFDRSCPDPQETLRLFAEWAEQCSDRVLRNAAKDLIRKRARIVHAHDIQDAVCAAAASIGEPIHDSVPGATWDPGGVHITEAKTPAQFAAWLAWHQ